MFTPGTSLYAIIIRTVLVYLAVLIGLRLSGKREIGQLTVFDLVVLLLLANAVQNAMVGPDTSVTGGLLAAGVLLILNFVVARSGLRWPKIRRFIEGSPTLLILHGKIIPEHLRREGLDKETLESALREHGVMEVSQVEMAVLEIDGSISVVPLGSDTRRVKHPIKNLHHQ